MEAKGKNGKKLGPSTESHKNWSRNLPYMSTIHAVSITTLRSAQGPRYSCFYNIFLINILKSAITLFLSHK